MARYDFLKEDTKRKLEERQERMIAKRKQEEVKEGKSKKKSGENEEKGPKVYTKEDGQIGGVIYPEGKSKKSRKPSDQLMGEESEGKERKKGNPGEENMPIKLHHTEKTKVGTEDRPEPAKTEKPGPKTEQKGNESNEKSEETEEAREEIWK